MRKLLLPLAITLEVVCICALVATMTLLLVSSELYRFCNWIYHE